ncbi:organomercurial lyase [Xanthobacter flavus]|uniref:organomercurial lyase n=1 Tax=Xanthobacter flavus TaxID=281 RepID=UPI00372ADB90
MAIDTTTSEQLSVEIRPGVCRPDWSAVTTPAAQQALNGRMAARVGLLDKWSLALDSNEDLVWRTVLVLYAENGRSPRASEIAACSDISVERVRAVLQKLQLHDLLGLEPGTDAIRYAYPFTETQTGHHVALKSYTLNSLCAIDALGVGKMYRSDITVESRCRLSGGRVRVTTGDEGCTLRNVSPAGAVVWYDFAYEGGTAASSCCPSIAFFCSEEQLRRWLDQQTLPRHGVVLSIDEALEVGCAIFGPVLTVPRAVSEEELRASTKSRRALR